MYLPERTLWLAALCELREEMVAWTVWSVSCGASAFFSKGGLWWPVTVEGLTQEAGLGLPVMVPWPHQHG